MENEIMNTVEEVMENKTTNGSSIKAEGTAAALFLIGTAALGHLVGEGIKAGYKRGKTWFENRKKSKAVLVIENTSDSVMEDVEG